MTTIYVLLDNDQIRYIGKTTKANLNDKLTQHQSEALLNPEKFGWIINLLSCGKKPEIKPIVSYSEDEAERYEKLFFNDLRFFLGLRLSNSETIKIQSLFQENLESNHII
jgi:hypothetical protein